MSWRGERERERVPPEWRPGEERRGGGPGQGLAGETLGLAHKHHILFRRDNLSPVFPLIYNLSGAKLLKENENSFAFFIRIPKKISKKKLRKV